MALQAPHVVAEGCSPAGRHARHLNLARLRAIQRNQATLKRYRHGLSAVLHAELAEDMADM